MNKGFEAIWNKNKIKQEKSFENWMLFLLLQANDKLVI
jgi:hypothetical protein